MQVNPPPPETVFLSAGGMSAAKAKASCAKATAAKGSRQRKGEEVV